MQLPAQDTPSALHRLLLQALVVASVQFPEPLQTDAVVTLPAVHIAAWHSVEASGYAQAVAFVPSHWALHFPVPPQAARGLTGSPWMALHVPTEPRALQDWHWPSHLPLQQTPSVQKPEVHWVPEEQPAPRPRVFAHVPVESQ